MAKTTAALLVTLIFFALPAIGIESNPAPDSPALVSSWKSPEPSADHVHSNGKDIISFIPFATCVDAGLENAKRDSKLLLVYIKKPGCPHCLSFESGVLRQPKLKQFIDGKFSCARVLNGSTDDRVFKRDFGCNAYPHFVIFTNDGKLVGKWFGLPKSAKDFEEQANSILKSS